MYIEVHFGGRFEVVGRKKRYATGDTKFIKDFSTDKMGWLELRYMLRKLGIKQDYNVYHQLPNKTMDDGLVLVETDVGVLAAMEFLGLQQNVIFYIEHLEAGHGKVELLPDYCTIDSPTEAGEQIDPIEVARQTGIVDEATTKKGSQDQNPYLSDELLAETYDVVIRSEPIIDNVEKESGDIVNSEEYLSDEPMSQLYDMSIASMENVEKESGEAQFKEKSEIVEVDVGQSQLSNENSVLVAPDENERNYDIGVHAADFSDDESYDDGNNVDMDITQKVLWGDSDEDCDGDEDYVPEPESDNQSQHDRDGGGEEIEKISETELEKEVTDCLRGIETIGQPEIIAGPSQPNPTKIKKKGEYIMAGPECEPSRDLGSQYSNSQSLHSVHVEDGEEVNSEQAGGPVYDQRRHTEKDLPEMGMEFGSPAEFRKMLRNYAITHGKDLFWLKNEGTKIIVKCKYEACPFHAYGGWKDKEKSKFVLKTLILQHTCARTLHNNQITAQFLAKKYLEHFRDDPKWTVKAFMSLVQRDMSCKVRMTKCYRARRLALDEIEGKHVVQYANLSRYANEILKTNPGSSAIIKTEPIPNSDETRFVGIFICLAALVDGLRKDCRPIIGLDGCHLKSLAGGVLLSAVSRDSNNQMFPIAWAVVGVECKESWTWFLTLLREAIGT